MNILHIAPSVRIGGVGSLLAGLLPRLDRERFRCEVLAEADPAGSGANRRALEAAGIPVRPIPPRVGGLRENLRAVDAALLAGSYDAVHLHLEEWSALYALLARRRGVPARIVHAHLAGVRLPFRFTARRLARPAALALLRGLMRREATHRAACSDDAGRWLFGDAPFTMLPNAVDTARFGFSADARRRTRAALGLGEAFTVGCAARFDQQKNLPFLLALFAELRRREPGRPAAARGRRGGGARPARRGRAAGNRGDGALFGRAGGRARAPSGDGRVRAAHPVRGLRHRPARGAGGGPALLRPRWRGAARSGRHRAFAAPAARLSAAGWAGEILAAKGLPRRCRAEEVEAAGCGAETAARRLEALYERCRAERGRGL